MFSIFARHLHSLTQLERTEILQTLTNISIYNAYCARANFLWRFPYELSEKAEMAKDEGIDLSVILSNQAPGVLNTPLFTRDIPPVCSWYPSGVLNTPQCTHDNPPHASCYPPSVLMITPWCTHDIPRCTEHPLFTHDIPPVCSWYPSGVLNTPQWDIGS